MLDDLALAWPRPRTRGMSQERLDATVYGRVQGVGFRYYVVMRAMALELTGWVANGPDGSVRCVAEGPRPALEALLATLETGPAGAPDGPRRHPVGTGQRELHELRGPQRGSPRGLSG